MPQIPYRQNFNLTWRVDLPEHLICALYWKTARMCSRRSILTGLSVRFQSPPSPTHSVRRKGRPSRSLIAIDRELVVNSRGVSMVVTQQPAQSLATLYGFVTTSFRDLGKQQDIGRSGTARLSPLARAIGCDVRRAKRTAWRRSHNAGQPRYWREHEV